MPSLSLDKVERFYKYHSLVYDWTRWTILWSRDVAIDRFVSDPDGGYLEIGCGTGLNFGKILKRLGSAGTLTGLDFSGDMLKVARKRVEKQGWQNVDLVRENAETFDLGRQFDGALFSYSLTMIPDWRAAVERTLAHLKPGGRIVILDFYTLEDCPKSLRWLFLTWLGGNHVDPSRNYKEYLSTVLEDFEFDSRNLGYNFIATGRRPA